MSGSGDLQSFLRKWRTAALSTLLILAGLAAAAVTLIARNNQNFGLAASFATVSLVVAGLILILIVPSLARNAFAELTRLDLPVEVTAGGVIFVCMIVIVGFAAWNTGNNCVPRVVASDSTLFVPGWARGQH